MPSVFKASNCGVNCVIYVKWFCFEVKWNEVSSGKSFGTKVPCTLVWPYTEGTWLYCDCLVWCVSCAVVVCTGFVLCGCVYVWVLCCVGVCMCGFCVVWVCVSGSILTTVWVFWQHVYWYLLCFCIVSFMYIYSYFFVFTNARTTATDWQHNCSNNNNNIHPLPQWVRD